MDVKVFGQVLRTFREKKGISQEKLAEYSELHPTFISMLETGKKQPTITTLFKLSKALEINVHDLIKEVENRLNDR